MDFFSLHQEKTKIIVAILRALELSDIAAIVRTSKVLQTLARPILYQIDARGVDPKALRWATRNGQIQTIKYSREAGTNIQSYHTSDGYSALHCATFCYGDSVEAVIKHLTENETDIEDDYYTAVGTPLKLACKNQNFRAAMALIEAGAEHHECVLSLCVSKIKLTSQGGLVPDEAEEEFKKAQTAIILKLHTHSLSYERPPFKRAICDGELFTVQLLIDLGDDVTELGPTPQYGCNFVGTEDDH